MMARTFRNFVVAAAMLVFLAACSAEDDPWRKEFDIAGCNMLTTGSNPYFVLEPGHQLVLEGDGEKVEITVLDETRQVDGVVTRIVEERGWKDGVLHEIARNYFAICEGTKDVFYFGEDVDFYEDGKVVNHEGSWLAGDGNKPGLLMPGTPAAGMKYYQELAPDVAMDRGEIVNVDEACQTPAGTFPHCLKVKEGTALDTGEEAYKYYAPGVGLVRDDELVLTKYSHPRG